MGKSHFLDIGYKFGRQFPVSQPPVVFLLYPCPGTEMNLIDGDGSIKSIVNIRFTDRQPVSSWERAASHEYGFYANVNPEVAHPRWSQARERRIGSEQGSGLQSLFAAAKQPTLMYNGYGEHVAHLYDGLDLRKNY